MSSPSKLLTTERKARAAAKSRESLEGFVLLAGIVAVMWLVEVINSLDHDALDSGGGIIPRNFDRVWAIFTAPFLHVSFTHLIAWSIVKALKSNASLNHAFAQEDGEPFRVVRTQVNIGLAVDVAGKDGQRSLKVPNVKNAEEMNFAQFIAAYDDIVARARTAYIADSRHMPGAADAAVVKLEGLQRALALRRRGEAWADVAAGAGYVDQPHLARECRALTGRAALAMHSGVRVLRPIWKGTPQSHQFQVFTEVGDAAIDEPARLPLDLGAAPAPASVPAPPSTPVAGRVVQEPILPRGATKLLAVAAAAVLALCDGRRTFAELVASLTERYQVRQADVVEDVAGLLHRLSARGLLRLSSSEEVAS